MNVDDLTDEDCWPDYDEDASECFQCGGEGFVYGCSWDWQCDTWDGDSCLCTRRCDICNPAPRDPAMDAVLSAALRETQPTSASGCVG